MRKREQLNKGIAKLNKYFRAELKTAKNGLKALFGLFVLLSVLAAITWLVQGAAGVVKPDTKPVELEQLKQEIRDLRKENKEQYQQLQNQVKTLAAKRSRTKIEATVIAAHVQPVVHRAVKRQVVYTGVRELARVLTINYFGVSQWPAMEQIFLHESDFRVTAKNPTSSAYGLCQALPAGKMASAGADWRTNPTTQIKWCLGYVKTRYGTPNEAWLFWQAHHWF